EVHTWSKLCHENIAPMLGISTEFDSTISIISEWIPLGNVHDHAYCSPFAPLDILPQLKDIANGLYYLHSHELRVVHGDLKGVNVPVSSNCRALLTDFSLSTLNISTFSMTVNPERGITLLWTAPELLEDDRVSMASDVWAFEMTTLVTLFVSSFGQCLFYS
ncbi:kinase-like domain-containing protein, partial [Pisolithus sp. B1]